MVRTVVRGITRLRLALIVLAVLGSSQARAEPEVTLTERVAAQRAIESVYWQHRSWPDENPAPKPQISAVISDASIRAEVDEYLRMSKALEDLWGRPITAVRLQRELNRMARDSAAPEILRDLFSALDHDARLIAETLVRQTLAERLLRDAYAKDARFHGELRRKAARAVERSASAAEMPLMGGVYTERTFRLADSVEDWERIATDGTALETADWQALLSRLADSMGTSEAELPLLEMSSLDETGTGLEVIAVLSRSQDRITVGRVVWPKVPFDSWWERVRPATGLGAAPAHGALTLPAVGGPASPSGPGAGCEDETWTPMSPFNPAGGQSLDAVWTGTEMIIWGGWNGAPMDTGARYDPALDSWTPTAPGPSARSGHSTVWTGTEMIVFGGCIEMCTDNDPVYVNFGSRYDPATDSWADTSIDADTPTERTQASAVWTGTEMIVWGGHDGSYMDSGGRYDPAADAWAPVTRSGGPQARRSHSAVWTGEEMIVWGGYNNDITLSNTALRYDPATDSWQQSAPANIENRRYHSAIWTGSEMIIWGGGLNTGSRYDPDADTWTPTSLTLGTPPARSFNAAVWTGTEMIVWGGQFSSYVKTGGRYDPATDSWTLTPFLTAPEARTNMAAVWTGTEMIVWGGLGSGVYFSDGARYHPGTDSWTMVTQPASLPRARFEHTAVWTGAEMIVWGGDMSYIPEVLNTGGVYNPATDSWVPTDAGASVPRARKAHSAVWTGLEMIVWGGSDQQSFHLNTGGLYSPATDSWRPTSLATGPPAARKGHASVWTGTEMIVWGGCDATCSTSVDTGGRYDPVSDSWSVMTVGAGTPAARKYMSAVWTGGEMIVWGGSAGGISGPKLQSGGRYDPAASAWLPTSLSEAPLPRQLHTAVWADGKMIVWGGRTGGGWYGSTGALYDPVTDAWTDTPSLGAPASRAEHTAVWTGSEMVIWGGEADEETSLHSGGRYDPYDDSWRPVDRDILSRAQKHTAVWTGSEMVVWGGWNEYLAYSKGARFCACVDWYIDADGDGFGEPSSAVCAAGQDPGRVRTAGDCDDTQAATHAGASEVNDGLDNQCSGDAGFGLVDEISGVSGFHDPEDRDVYSWTAQSGATSYEVARSTEPDFSADCSSFATTEARLSDPEIPQSGESFYYLTRATAPATGSWGADFLGVERSFSCP